MFFFLKFLLLSIVYSLLPQSFEVKKKSCKYLHLKINHKASERLQETWEKCKDNLVNMVPGDHCLLSPVIISISLNLYQERPRTFKFPIPLLLSLHVACLAVCHPFSVSGPVSP